MQAIPDIAPLDLVTVSEMEACRAARAYVVDRIDPAFAVDCRSMRTGMYWASMLGAGQKRI